MKIIRAIFLAELRGHRALALGIVTLLGLQGMLQTHWIYDATPMISLSLQAILALLCVLLLSKSLWHDAPLRKERYLATRPTNLLRLYLGKYAAFLAVIAVPCALVEFLRVRYFSFDLNIQAAAALQMFLIYASAIAAFISVFWWMHSKKSIFMMWVTIVGAGVASNYYFGQQPQSYNNGWSAGVPYSPFMILLLFASFAMISAIRLLRLKKWNVLISCALIVVIVFVSMQLAINVSTLKLSDGSAQKCHIVNISSYAQQQSKVRELKVTVPHEDFDRESESHWSFNEAKLNGKDYTPWHTNSSMIDSKKDEIFRVVKERYPHAKVYEWRGEMSREAAVSVPKELSEEMLYSKKISLSHKKYHWKIIIDLPLYVGARASYHNFSCHIDAVTPKNFRSMYRAYPLALQRMVTVTQCNPFGSNNPRNDISEMHYLMIIDPVSGEITPDHDYIRIMVPSLNQSVHYSYQVANYLQRNHITDRRQPYTEHAHVLILAPEIIEEKSYTWEHSAPMREQVNTPTSEVLRNKIARRQDPDAWIEENPAPPLHASLMEREMWVNEFIDYAEFNAQLIFVFRKNYSIMQAHKMHIELFAKAHHEGRLPKCLQEYEFASAYPREFLQRYPNLAYSWSVVREFHRKGWSADLVDTARDMLRRGQGAIYKDVILSEPKRMNLTHDEWIDFFRLYSNARPYELMKTKLLPSSITNEIVDRYLAVHPDVELGLMRGHTEAPRWLKMKALSNDYYDKAKMLTQLRHYFDPNLALPSLESQRASNIHPLVEWFVSFDPDTFFYDAAKQKYILKPTP
jgi:hypothetical protein